MIGIDRSKDGRGSRPRTGLGGTALWHLLAARGGAQDDPPLADDDTDLRIEERNAKKSISCPAGLALPSLPPVSGAQNGSIGPHRGPGISVHDRDATEP